ncbi:uncharacterized protein [Branchiostoma lanceolatum]|uniref:uncharacterized protein n=1 Tax=Branchiostoma lanceolatum TaxID=7740 RepID=UPI003453A4C2
MANTPEQCNLSRDVVLVSKIDGTHFLGARVSQEKTLDNFDRFTVPCNIIKGLGRCYIQLYSMECYTFQDLQSQKANFVSGDRLEERERQEVEGMLWYIFVDSDSHFASRIRHMKKYATVDGRTAVALSCREFNHTTGRPIVLILGETPALPRQIDETSLVTNKHNRGDELTEKEGDLAISMVERLVEGLPDYELKLIPLSASTAKSSRVRKRLSNGTEVPSPQECHCPPLPTPEDEIVGRILIDFFSHREQGCNGDCHRCSRLIAIVQQTVGCRAINCTHKAILVKDYLQHKCHTFGPVTCSIPFCKDSRHLTWDKSRREELRPWIVNDVVENIIRTIIYPCQPLSLNASN